MIIEYGMIMIVKIHSVMCHSKGAQGLAPKAVTKTVRGKDDVLEFSMWFLDRGDSGRTPVNSICQP